MPAYCTCGTLLVEDARFCHKCGRPTREEFVEAEAVPPPLPAASLDLPPAALPEVGFQNKIAVRIGLLLAGPMFVVSNLLFLLPGGPLLSIVGLLATGLIAVVLYRQRTQTSVSVMSGARMGWMVGLFIFIITLVLVTVVFSVTSTEELTRGIREQKELNRFTPEQLEQMTKLFTQPSAILLLVAWNFMMSTTLPSLGGALGAKLLDSSSSKEPGA